MLETERTALKNAIGILAVSQVLMPFGPLLEDEQRAWDMLDHAWTYLVETRNGIRIRRGE